MDLFCIATCRHGDDMMQFLRQHHTLHDGLSPQQGSLATGFRQTRLNLPSSETQSNAMQSKNQSRCIYLFFTVLFHCFSVLVLLFLAFHCFSAFLAFPAFLRLRCSSLLFIASCESSFFCCFLCLLSCLVGDSGCFSWLCFSFLSSFL